MKKVIFLLLVITSLGCDTSDDETRNEINRKLKIELESLTSVGINQVSGSAKIENYNLPAIETVGFCWHTEPNPTIFNDTINSSFSSGQFTFSTTTLEPNSTYYLRAFALSEGNTYYSNELEFKTKSLEIVNNITYIYDSNYNEEGISAIGTSDGGFIVAGNLNFSYGRDGDIVLLKYNSECEIIWQNVLSDSNTNQYVIEIIEDTSGDYLVISALYKDNTYEPTLSKFDQSGNLLWEKNMDERINDENGIYAFASIIETKDGNYALAGNWNPDRNGSLYPDSNYSLLKVSRDGDVLFKKNYGLPNYTEHAWALLENFNEDIILIGTIPGQNNNSSDLKLIKLTSNGTIIWEKKYGGANSDFAESAINTQDGNIVIAGFSKSFSDYYRAWLTKIDWDGNIIWENIIGRENKNLILRGNNAIVEDKNSNFLLAGTISSSVYTDMYSSKLSKEGKLIWDKILNSTEIPRSFDKARSVIALSNGEIILVGNKEDEENPRFDGGTSDIWIVKIKEN